MLNRSILCPLIVTAILASVFMFGCATTFQKAHIKDMPPLEYPLGAQMDEREGEVVLAVYISQDSAIKSLEIQSSSGYADLDSAAMEFGRKVKYIPAQKDNAPIPSWTLLRLNYKLDKTPFAQEKWLREIHLLHKRIAKTSDSYKREKALEELYDASLNLAGSLSLDKSPRINHRLKKLVSDPVYDDWQSLEEVIPLPFVVLKDYLYRYPSSARYNDVKSRLLQFITVFKQKVIDYEGDIPRIQERKDKIIEFLDQRISELENNHLSLRSEFRQ
ncbi:MAG: energy transducer TonB [candidate division KSB1 bacterium]|nr:energy transducer TonB [candidate division KSB1 bacterium]